MTRQPHLFLDCDGVLADFDAGAHDILAMSPAQFEARHGRGEFWKRLARAPNFYGSLEEMPDAQRLFAAVKHLKPTILTGLPLGKWAAPQKEEWAARHFPGVPIITTMAREKHLHMEKGDVLVDDRENHRGLWEDAGGIFVHHKNAEDTLRELAKIYPSIATAARASPIVRRPKRPPSDPPSRPIPARTPARGSTSPARSPRSR